MEGALIFTWFLGNFTKNVLLVSKDEWKSYIAPHSKSRGRLVLGILLSCGYASYFCGKITASAISSATLPNSPWYFQTGVTNLYVTIIGSAAAIFFMSFLGRSSSEVWLHIVFYGVGRFCQAVGWNGMVEIVSNWIEPQWYGRAMSACSLGFLIGDAAVRALLGLILNHNGKNKSWRRLFRISALCTSVGGTLTLLIFVRNQPWISLLANRAREKNDFGMLAMYQLRHKEKQAKHREVVAVGSEVVNYEANICVRKFGPVLNTLRYLCQNSLFVYTVLLSFAFSMFREMLNSYLALYLKHLGFSLSQAAAVSALFPGTGVISAIFCGWWMDRTSESESNIHRANEDQEKKQALWIKLTILPICAFFLIFAFLTLVISSSFSIPDLSETVAIILVCIFGLLILGPYTLFAGVLSLEIGKQSDRSPGMIAGYVDAAGYVGALIIIGISSESGFRTIFIAATLVTFGAFLVGLALCKQLRKLSLASTYDKL